MKHRLIHSIAAGAALLLLFGCQAEDDMVTAGRKGIRIQPALQTATAAATRTVAGVEAFSENDVIGISSAIGEEAPLAANSNRSYKYAGNAWTSIGEPVYWMDETSQHTLRAYYPYDEKAYAAAATAADFALALNEAGDIDLNIDGAYAAADKAWGKVTAEPADQAVTIPMTHRMAQIIISLKPGEGVEAVDGMSVELLAPTNGFAGVGTFNILDGSVSVAASQPANRPQKTQMLKAANGDFYALVVPGQTFKAGSAFARIKDAANNKAYVYDLALASGKDLTTVSNQPVKFTLSVALGKVSGMGVTAEDWNSPTTVSPIELVKEEEGWLVVTSTAGQLQTTLTSGIASTSSLKKLWIKGAVNADDLGSNPSGTRSGLNAYIADNNITDLRIDATTPAELGSYILKGCTSLVSVELGSIPTSENNCLGLFDGCTGLKSVVLGDATRFPQAVFNGCTSLTTVVAPKVTAFAYNSFKNCSVLETLVVKELGAMTNAGIEGHYPTSLFLTGVKQESGDLSSFASCDNTGAGSNPTTYTFPEIHVNYSGGTTVADYTDVTKYGRTYPEQVIEGGVVTINCSTVGDLSGLLNDRTATKLNITGTINAADFAALIAYIKAKNVTDLCLNADGATLSSKIFLDCISLVNIQIMKITTMATGLFAWQGCTGLETLYMPDLEAIPYGFMNAANIKAVIAPKASLNKANNPFTNLTVFSKLVLGNYVECISTTFLCPDKSQFDTANLEVYLVKPVNVSSNETLGSSYSSWSYGTGSYEIGNLWGTFDTTVEVSSYESYLKKENYKYSWKRN